MHHDHFRTTRDQRGAATKQRVRIAQQVGDDHHTFDTTHSFEQWCQLRRSIDCEVVDDTNHLAHDVTTRTRCEPARSGAKGNQQADRITGATTHGSQPDAEHARLSPLGRTAEPRAHRRRTIEQNQRG